MQYYDLADVVTADGGGAFTVDFGGPMDGHVWDLRRVAVARADDPAIVDGPGLLIVYSAKAQDPPPTEIDVAFGAITTPFGVPLTSRSCIAVQHERFVAQGVFSAGETYVVTGLVIDEEAT